MMISYRAVYHLLDGFPRYTLKAYLEIPENKIALEAGKLVGQELGDSSFEEVLVDYVDEYDEAFAVFITPDGILPIPKNADFSIDAMAALFMKIKDHIHYKNFEATIEAQAENKLEDPQQQINEFCEACSVLKEHFKSQAKEI
jgi:hypothetical protein